MKKNVLVITLMVFLAGQYPLFGAPDDSITDEESIVECSTQKYFSDNACDVCQMGGEAVVDAGDVVLSEVIDLTWTNTLSGINQNFYETSQLPVLIKTNIGTSSVWDEKGIVWGENVVWKNLDGINMFSLDAGKNLVLKKIESKTKIPLTDIKTPTSPYFVTVIPVSYFELKMGTFKESDKKTVNYCVSYTPKVLSASATTTTTASAPVKTATAPTTPVVTPAIPSVTTDASLDIDSLTSGEESEEIEEVTPEESQDTSPEEASDISTTSIEEPLDSAPEIVASYTSDVSSKNVSEENTIHNAASEVPTGPVSNILILLAISSLIGYFIMFRAKAF